MTDLHAESTKDNPIAKLCEPVGVSKQAYYQYDEDIAIAKAIREDLPSVQHWEHLPLQDLLLV